MRKRNITPEDFYNYFNEKFNFKFEFPDLLCHPNFNGVKTDIKMICPIHGEINTTINKVNSAKHGCPNCGTNTRTHKQWLEEFNKKYKGKYQYPGFEDIELTEKSSTKIKVLCLEHGEWETTPSKHMYNGCYYCGKVTTGKKISKTHEDFVKELELKNEYYIRGDFKLLEKYKNHRTKIKVKDKYGVCEITPNKLLRGDRTMITSAVDMNDYYKNRAEEVHGTEHYDYTFLDYTTADKNLKLKCNIHNEFFEQIAYVHLQGYGCNKCGRITMSKKSKINNRLNSHGWKPEKWKEKAMVSKTFDSFKVYIIECWNDNERFYKVGRTFNSVLDRFRGENKNTSLPYYFKTIYVSASLWDYEFICKEEKRIQAVFKDFKYTPTIEFNGMHECFSEIDLSQI